MDIKIINNYKYLLFINYKLFFKNKKKKKNDNKMTIVSDAAVLTKRPIGNKTAKLSRILFIVKNL